MVAAVGGHGHSWGYMAGVQPLGTQGCLLSLFHSVIHPWPCPTHSPLAPLFGHLLCTRPGRSLWRCRDSDTQW